MVAIVGHPTHVTTEWKWFAVLIGLGVIALICAFIAVTTKTIGWRVWKLVEGADGVSSTSKFQWLVWLTVILFSYTVLWVLRARTGDYSAISSVPANLLTVLGFSTATAVGAKGITVGYLQSNRISKPTPATPTAPGASRTGGILEDDTGTPELAKIQMVAFTFIAVGIFLATVVHEIHTNQVQMGLPNIDSSLLVLMGISQGGYLGKKLVTINPPPPPSPPAA